MAASVFSSRLLAAATLRSRPPGTALRAAAQVLSPSLLLLRRVGRRQGEAGGPVPAGEACRDPRPGLGSLLRR